MAFHLNLTDLQSDFVRAASPQPQHILAPATFPGADLSAQWQLAGNERLYSSWTDARD
jgi:hypothetical protein